MDILGVKLTSVDPQDILKASLETKRIFNHDSPLRGHYRGVGHDIYILTRCRDDGYGGDGIVALS